MATRESVSKRIVAGLAVAMAGAAIALVPNATADTSPLLPYGTNPQVQTPIGPQISNHDETNTTNGEVDLPF